MKATARKIENQRSSFDSGTLLQRGAQKPLCGPDVTDWFVKTIAAAKEELGTALAKQALARAQWAGNLVNIDARKVVEGGLKQVILGMKKKNPAPESAQKQLAAADQTKNLKRTVEAKNLGVLAALDVMLLNLGLAGAWWYSKVRTGGGWDFKNNVLQDPKPKGCPAEKGKPTITLCGQCQENDVPGNVFYGHLGAHLGFSRTAILLGSNYANLLPEGGDDWDPRIDIDRVNHGYDLPNKVTEAALCSGLPPTDASFPEHGCVASSEKFP